MLTKLDKSDDTEGVAYVHPINYLAYLFNYALSIKSLNANSWVVETYSVIQLGSKKNKIPL